MLLIGLTRGDERLNDPLDTLLFALEILEGLGTGLVVECLKCIRLTKLWILAASTAGSVEGGILIGTNYGTFSRQSQKVLLICKGLTQTSLIQAGSAFGCS